MAENLKKVRQEFIKLEIMRNNANDRNDKIFEMTVPNKGEEVGKLLEVAEFKGMSKPIRKNKNWYD
jgi:hypothetical protein